MTIYTVQYEAITPFETYSAWYAVEADSPRKVEQEARDFIGRRKKNISEVYVLKIEETDAGNVVASTTPSWLPLTQWPGEFPWRQLVYRPL